MNNETQTTVATEAMPFPSHVKSPAPNNDVVVLSREIVDISRDANNLLASAGNVHKFVRTHYVDTASGIYGIESLIASILKAHGAQFPKGIEATEFRKVAINASMFASEIIAEVREAFGNERYPDSVIHSYLSHFMIQPKSANKVGKIKLSKHEDATRTCCKPRTKFYLLEA